MKIYINTTSAIGKKCSEWAKENLPNNFEFSETIEDCDIFFSAFHNKLISEEFINTRKRCFNFHGGILPEYRGSGTINWAIINGEKETGITLHEIDSKIDHGPIIEIKKIPIGENETAQSLYNRLELLIFEMFKDWFLKLIHLSYSAVPQDHSRAKLYLRKDLEQAKDITRFAKAFEFHGKEQAFYFDGNGNKIYLKYNKE